ncbi:heat stress transcription factor-like protein [Medicago truncatula]|uniref:Heat stress transcription factor-like protein n=1 Tax=Medicago truncatula TaxID=3880 RepID=G7KJ07_MEDTR|nr:heat stress transcription factor-like protein [Medicago truncatula]
MTNDHIIHQKHLIYFKNIFYIGFQKADPDRWEFSDEEFIEDPTYLLKNIHRRKPIHSYSHPRGYGVDPKKAALEQEIEKLSHEKNAIQSKLSSYNYLEKEKLKLEDFQRRLDGMEKRQTNLQNFFEKALQDSFIVELLSGKFESKDLAAYNKKRRLSQVDQMQLVAEGRLVDHPNVESLQKNLYEGELTGMQTRVNVDGKEFEIRVSSNRNVANEAINLADPKEVSDNVQVEVAARQEVNDVFWEQFLTEKPCYSNNEEAISN